MGGSDHIWMLGTFLLGNIFVLSVIIFDCIVEEC